MLAFVKTSGLPKRHCRPSLQSAQLARVDAKSLPHEGRRCCQLRRQHHQIAKVLRVPQAPRTPQRPPAHTACTYSAARAPSPSHRCGPTASPLPPLQAPRARRSPSSAFMFGYTFISVCVSEKARSRSSSLGRIVIRCSRIFRRNRLLDELDPLILIGGAQRSGDDREIALARAGSSPPHPPACRRCLAALPG